MKPHDISDLLDDDGDLILGEFVIPEDILSELKNYGPPERGDRIFEMLKKSLSGPVRRIMDGPIKALVKKAADQLRQRIKTRNQYNLVSDAWNKATEAPSSGTTYYDLLNDMVGDVCAQATRGQRKRKAQPEKQPEEQPEKQPEEQAPAE